MSDDGGEDAEAFDIDQGEEGGGDDVYTETTHEDLGDRLQGACCGICIGLLLFFGSFPLLFWNEGRAVDRHDALNEAETQTSSIDATSPLDPANEGKLLHFSVDVTNGGDALVDPIFGIKSVNGSLVLRRDAEMYQWIETSSSSSKKDLGGGKTTTTTYTYQKEWRNRLVSSQNYKKPTNHRNPSSMEFESLQLNANPIMIGSYELPMRLESKLTWGTPMTVTVDDIPDESLRNRTKQTTDGFYFGNSIDNSQIGDQKITFAQTPPSTITVVGVQSGNTLSAFVAENGEGGDVLLFRQGKYSAAEMYEEAESQNAVLSWFIRFGGFLLMTSGLYLIFRPIEVFADIVPCVGDIVGCGLIFMSVVISAVLSSITISIAWLVAHPMIGGIVLLVTLAVVGCCAFGVKKLQQMRNGDDDGDNASRSAPETEKNVDDD
mmetsp:Transcript_33662/g.62032  ORF Transcript_33662/g.62032 Transcript_33662/m.62032 type:complete len:434 (+) Transcript_33662:192-1493(+)|eukprot:CAMPEP_0196143468 /NCGR_PEP_ID=MMETSP0910-20130528/13428_1 /TAXON_ID=49265 /ORGANISM="Thalassiosira rotula, Strain GSO102" /LENGTH=433 /DNA_ID=CAMNT_0041404931 /DNA_START=160 /DNA_END=1461 /DNA_ORIENTATION=+